MSKNGFVDKTKAIVYERGAYTASGYNEIIATFKLKKDAEEYVRHLDLPKARYIAAMKSHFHL